MKKIPVQGAPDEKKSPSFGVQTLKIKKSTTTGTPKRKRGRPRKIKEEMPSVITLIKVGEVGEKIVESKMLPLP